MLTANEVVLQHLKANESTSSQVKAWATIKLNRYLQQEEAKGRNRNRVLAGIRAQITKKLS